MTEGDRLTYLRLLPDALRDPGLAAETLALIASRLQAGGPPTAHEGDLVAKAVEPVLARAEKAEADAHALRTTIARQRQALEEARRAP